MMMKDFKLILLIGLISCFTPISNARHLYSRSFEYPTESFEIDEEEAINDKFNPASLETFLSKMRDSEEVPTRVGFAEASPDVVLERLIDEADEERHIENAAQGPFINNQFMMDEEDTNGDLNGTL